MRYHPNQPYSQRREVPWTYRDLAQKYRELPKTGLAPSAKALMANEFISDLWFRQGHDNQVQRSHGMQLDKETGKFEPVSELEAQGKLRDETGRLLATKDGAVAKFQILIEQDGPFRSIAMHPDKDTANRLKYGDLWTMDQAAERSLWGANHPGLEFNPVLVMLDAYSNPTWRVGYHVRGFEPAEGMPGWFECPPGWFGGDHYMGPEPVTADGDSASTAYASVKSSLTNSMAARKARKRLRRDGNYIIEEA